MYIEIKYLNLLSVRLPKFKRKKEFLWNFRCPVCGDSKHNKNKARGFVYQFKGQLLYKCHNCQLSISFDRFLEMMDPVLYKEYRMEKFTESKPRRITAPQLKKAVSATPHFERDVLRDLTPVDNLNTAHPAREYLLNRRLPTEALYYTESFKAWTNSIKPDTFPEESPDEERIIIPFRDKEGSVFGYQGRSLCNDGLRYITVLLDDKPKIFGLNTIDYDKPIYITEGPFDSLLLDNSIAMAGADANTRQIGGGDYIWVYDNEPRNKQITARISKHIGDGDKVVIWDSRIKQKDINEMFLAGIDVQSVIESSVYSGLTATLKFNEWRK